MLEPRTSHRQNARHLHRRTRRKLDPTSAYDLLGRMATHDAQSTTPDNAGTSHLCVVDAEGQRRIGHDDGEPTVWRTLHGGR